MRRKKGSDPDTVSQSHFCIFPTFDDEPLDSFSVWFVGEFNDGEQVGNGRLRVSIVRVREKGGSFFLLSLTLLFVPFNLFLLMLVFTTFKEQWKSLLTVSYSQQSIILFFSSQNGMCLAYQSINQNQKQIATFKAVF
eukprot:TRINITY_DN831_c0_g1_i1.p1 TRINITY_DN831_c0_g1~~TRINITY_DN831_c0_g1_i1.p1  ORF type:complete len:137 (+),score=3.23 TRINITY_DN831_c0_g1_i1:823-1233(+)